MAMTTAVRDGLLKIHQQERDDLRCVIAKRLNNEAKEITKDENGLIKSMEGTIESHKNTIQDIQNDISKQKILRDSVLKDAKLFNIGKSNMSGCDLEGQHPDLIEFDHETRDLRKAILNRT